MNTPIEHIFSDVETFFESPATAEEKAWGMIHDFYHLVLTYMEEQQISKADLSKRLGKSRSAISQMFNKTPNISLKKMVEIADAIGLDLRISSPQIHASKKQAEPLGNFRLAETYQEHDADKRRVSGKHTKAISRKAEPRLKKRDDVSTIDERCDDAPLNTMTKETNTSRVER